MMQTLAINSSGDLYLDNNGNIAVVTGIDAVSQCCVTACKVRLGEMFLATNDGIPFFEAVWTGNPNIPRFQAAIRQTLLNVANVLEVRNLIVTIQNDVLSYSATIITIFGTTDVSDATSL